MLTPMGDCLLPIFFGEPEEETPGWNWTRRGEDTKRGGQDATEAWDLSLDSEPVPIIPLCAMYGPTDLVTQPKPNEPRVEISQNTGAGSSSDRVAISG